MSGSPFQQRLQSDLDRVFLKAEGREFVTTHRIGGIRGKPPVELDVVADQDLYMERASNGNVENLSLDGVVVFMQTQIWQDAFGSIPKVDSVLKFDRRDYRVKAVNDDMGLLEITLSGARG